VARLHADEADAHLVPWIADRTSDDLVTLGRASGLAVAPILSVREPQFAFRDFLDEPTPGTRTATVPWRLEQVPDAEPVRPWQVTGEQAEPTRLLESLRVLDLSWVWSGP
jgi:hypothetical protein